MFLFNRSCFIPKTDFFLFSIIAALFFSLSNVYDVILEVNENHTEYCMVI